MARKAELPQDLRTFYTMYYVGLGAQNSSDRTLRVYKETLEGYYRFLEATLKRPPLLSDMDVNTARAWVQHLKERKAYEGHPTREASSVGLSSHTIQRHVRTLKAFSSWLVKDEKVEDDPLAKLKRYKVDRRVIATLSDDEIGRIFEAIDTRTKLGARDYAMVFLLLDTGIRAGELCGLTMDNIHLEQDPGWIKVRGKGAKERIVVLGRKAHQILQSYMTYTRGRAPSDFLFMKRDGEPVNVNTLDQIIGRLGDRAGVPRLHPHLFRHTMATQYLVAGGDVISLQQKIGHSTVATTAGYVHLVGQHMAQIQQRISPMDKVRVTPFKRKKGQLTKAVGRK